MLMYRRASFLDQDLQVHHKIIDFNRDARQAGTGESENKVWRWLTWYQFDQSVGRADGCRLSQSSARMENWEVARTMTWSSRRPLFPCFLIVFDLIFNNSIFCLSIWMIPWPFLTHLWITTELTRIDQLQLLKVFIDGQFATWRNRDPSHPFSPTAHMLILLVSLPLLPLSIFMFQPCVKDITFPPSRHGVDLFSSVSHRAYAALLKSQVQ